MTKRERVLKILVLAACVMCVSFSLFCPKEASEAAFRAISLCAKSVVPSLFLFMVSSKILLGCGGAEAFSRATHGGVEKLLGVSKSGSVAVFLGLLCGYPTGAVVIADALSRGKMKKSEAQSLLPFVTAASPAFLVGAVGSSLFSSGGYGAVLLLAQTLSALILMLITRKSRFGSAISDIGAEEERPFLTVISSSVKESGTAVIYVCSFVTFFCVFSEMILCFLPCGGAIKALVNGFFEISGGFALLSQNAQSFFEKYFLGGTMLGFSGASVLMQSASVLADSGVSMKRYAAGKAAQSILCGVLSLALGAIFEKSAPVFAFTLFGTEAPKMISAAEFAVIFAFVFAILAFFTAVILKILSFFSKKRENFQKTVEKKR